MLRQLLRSKRTFVFLGESGSGKSEMSIFFAQKLLEYTGKTIWLIDMDQTKGMFRSRDWKNQIENERIQVCCGEHFMDMPLVPHGMVQKLENKDAIKILDVGGNEAGAVVLGQFSQWLNAEDCSVFYLINPYRNFSGSQDNILFFMDRIRNAGRIQNVHIISNPNLGKSTQEEDVINGQRLLEKMLSGTGYQIEALMIPNWVDEALFSNWKLPVYSFKPQIQFLSDG